MKSKPPGITDKQWQARLDFDIDAQMAALPPLGPTGITAKGAAGYRMRAHHVADISDGLLREFARETLRAQRMSEQYLYALRIVLGNQAAAERYGYVLEMNRRVSFAPENVVRTILHRMQSAGVSKGRPVDLGTCRRQVVQCFSSAEDHGEIDNGNAADDLEEMYRQAEGERPYKPACHTSVQDEEFLHCPIP